MGCNLNFSRVYILYLLRFFINLSETNIIVVSNIQEALSLNIDHIEFLFQILILFGLQ